MSEVKPKHVNLAARLWCVRVVFGEALWVRECRVLLGVGRLHLMLMIRRGRPPEGCVTIALISWMCWRCVLRACQRWWRSV